MRRGLGAAVELDEPGRPQFLQALARPGDPGRGLPAHQQGAHGTPARIDAPRLHRAAQMERVRGRADDDGRLESIDDGRPHLGGHPAPGNARHVHLGERGVDAPGEHVRPEAGADQRAIAWTEAERMKRPRVGPRPQLAVDLGVAEDARAPRRAGRGEHHPAPGGPQIVTVSRVGAERRGGLHVRDHLRFVDDRPSRQVFGGGDVGGRQAQAVEASAVERAVLVEERRQRRELRILDRREFVAARTVERRRPVAFRCRRIGIAAIAVHHSEPRRSRLRCSVARHRFALVPFALPGLPGRPRALA